MEILTAGRMALLILASAAMLALAGAAVGASAWRQPEAEDDGAAAPRVDEPPEEAVEADLAGDLLEPEGLPEATVHLKVGRPVTGLVEKLTDEEIVLRVSGVSVRFARADVDHIRRLPPVEERYRQMRDAIGEDGEQLVLLVKWLMERERFGLALAEAKRAVKLAPDSAEALRTLRVVEGRIALRRSQRPDLAEREEEEPRPETPGPRPARPVFPLLTEAQINLLRVYEVDLKDPPRIVISRETVEDLLTAYAGSPLIPESVEGRDAIRRWRDVEILELMFRLRARDFYGRVEVLDNPESMKLFRDEVNRSWLVNTCATNRCHGGEQAGRLRLFNRRPNAAASFYTNFLILDGFRLADGTPLIDYEDPDQSPLLYYAMAREESLHPHPVVRNSRSGRDEFRPAFRSKSDRRARKTIEWIRSMYLPHPDYPIDYDPPEGSGPPPQAEPEER